jgi:hypothetical protein
VSRDSLSEEAEASLEFDNVVGARVSSCVSTGGRRSGAKLLLSELRVRRSAKRTGSSHDMFFLPARLMSAFISI